jgi:hypothetical protein
LWNLSSGKEIACLFHFDGDDWVVVTPDRRFDASPGGMARLHYNVGNTIVDLQQFKDKYYVPGLASRLLGDTIPSSPVPQ